MTQHGETDDFDVMDHVHALNRHMGTDFIDYVICCGNEDYSEQILETIVKSMLNLLSIIKKSLKRKVSHL